MIAGYSGTPLLRKLGIKTDSNVLVIQPPSEFLKWIRSEHTSVLTEPTSSLADVILLFAEWESFLDEHLPSAIQNLSANGGLWIAWPKKASKCPTDITENRLRDIILPSGLVDNKVCAIDEKWSGLRFVWRVELRNAIRNS